MATINHPANQQPQEFGNLGQISSTATPHNPMPWVIVESAGTDNENLVNYASLKGSLNELRQEATEAKTQSKNLQAANTELIRDLDRAQRQIEMLASFKTDLAKAQTALTSSEAARIEAERSAAVLSAQLDAKSEKANELEARLKTAETLTSSKDTELKQANNHYQACAARLEAAAREIESLRKKPAPAKAATPKKTATAKKPDGNS